MAAVALLLILRLGVQIQSVFETADAAGMMLYSKEPNTVGCDGWQCGEW
jgi:hypothetical protein